MKRTWPQDWESRKQGAGCPFCADLTGQSFHSGRVSEALLERHAIANGHVAVVFRCRHVAAFTDLAQDELANYWADIQDVGRTVERVFKPCHVNYLLLGNIVPHLHVHIVPRYLDDAAPERPLSWNASPVPEELFTARFRQLKDATMSPNPAEPIDQIAVHLETAFNAGDAKALASLYTDNATLMPPNQPAIFGKREIESWFARVLQRLRSVRILPIESTIMGDHAFQVGTFTSMPNPVDGSSSAQESGTAITAKYVLVLRSSTGVWKIQHDIWNLDLPITRARSGTS